MLLPYTTLTYYGSAAGAMVVDTPAIDPQLSIGGLASVNLDVVITNPTPNLKATRLVNSPLIVQGTGVLQEATPKGTARGLLDVSIGATPSAFDIAQSVWLQNAAAVNIAGTTGGALSSAGSSGDPWSSVIESGYTAKEILQILAAVAVGKTTITDLGAGNATVKFRDINDNRDAVVADMTGSSRIDVTLT